MRLNQLSKTQLAETAEAVERGLASKTPSKAEVVRQLATLGYCSPKSTGTERTFLNLLTSNSIPLGPLLSAALGLSAPPAPPAPPQVAPPTAAQVAPPIPAPAVPSSPPEKLVLQMTGGISRVIVGASSVLVCATDGNMRSFNLPSGPRGFSFASSNFNLIELTES